MSASTSTMVALPMRILALILALALLPAPAAADPLLVISANSHGVVTFNNLPHCANEDGSGGTRPCTWNIPLGTDGDGVGLQYWIDGQGNDSSQYKAVYVWSPTPIQGNRRWSTVYPRCWINDTITPPSSRCPNGQPINW